jgi:hypothetical protein
MLSPTWPPAWIGREVSSALKETLMPATESMENNPPNEINAQKEETASPLRQVLRRAANFFGAYRDG